MVKNKKINGPINVLRVEGTINNVKKVLYVFMDIHVELGTQTKCDDYLSEDITRYLKKELLKNKDKTIDFFMEYRITDPESDFSNLKQKYLHEMWDFFYSNYKNKGKEFKNVRVHYVDIRHNMLFSLQHILKNYYCYFNNDDHYNNIIKEYDKHVDYINEIHDIITGKISKHTISSAKEFSKIFDKYKHKNIQHKLLILIDKFVDTKNKMIQLVNVNKKLLSEHFLKCHASFTDKGYYALVKDDESELQYGYDDSNIIDKLNKNHRDIYFVYVESLSNIMDVYFLRRFCDKEYITNGIFYGGSAHCVQYINFLVNQFDFKITHASYTFKPIDEINDLLKKKLYEWKDILYLFFPPVLNQCSDISFFPDNFE